MYQVILVDDEPLILAGIASLLVWEEYDCTIVGKATNGPCALQMILDHKPDIVITDIRMPVMNGLELIQTAKEQGQEFAFLVLTNLEEFQLAKQAVRLGAIDYLVKLDLTPDALADALKRAKEACNRLKRWQQRKQYQGLLQDNARQSELTYWKQLLLSPSSAPLPTPDGLSTQYTQPFLIQLSMRPENLEFGQPADYDYAFIQQQLIDVLSGILSRYFQAYTILNPEKAALLLVLSSKAETTSHKSIADCCTKMNNALCTYFGLAAIFGVSTRKDDLTNLPDALLEAQSAQECYYYDSRSPIVFYQGPAPGESFGRDFNINLLKKPLSLAIARNDTEGLYLLFQEVSHLFAQYQPDKSQAVSACLHLYAYMSGLFQNENAKDLSAFPYTINVAEQLKQMGSLENLLAWLDSFCAALCTLMKSRNETKPDKLIALSKQYINSHYQEKLTLSDVADALNISAGHLSNTFSKAMNMTLLDYIAQIKMEHAKAMINTHQYMIYEVANQLGYENAYYFSKVFRKVTGMSPREYEQNLDYSNNPIQKEHEYE